MRDWSEEVGCEWKAVRRKIRILAITVAGKTSPKAWRWWQHADWIQQLESGSFKSVSVPWEMWSYLGNYQEKSTLSFTPKRWARIGSEREAPTEAQAQALRLGLYLFLRARSGLAKESFKAELTTQNAMKFAWFRTLVREL